MDNSGFCTRSYGWGILPFDVLVHYSGIVIGCPKRCRQKASQTQPTTAISRVVLTVHPQALKLAGVKKPHSGLDSKWSIFHSAAVALARGAAGEHEFTDASIVDPNIASFREKIEATADTSLRQDEARVMVTLQDGQISVQHIDHALGSAKHPLSDGDLETKFLGLAKGVLDHAQVQRIIQLCWSVADLDDISEISRKSIPLSEY